VKRREFITLLGVATVTWPLVARAQQPAVPVIGFLNSASPQGYGPRVAAFRQGLKEGGYSEGQNVTVEYRWAEGQYDRVPVIALELLDRRVAVLVANTRECWRLSPRSQRRRSFSPPPVIRCRSASWLA
jgi:putative ABC transport system substrate-binding protein